MDEGAAVGEDRRVHKRLGGKRDVGSVLEDRRQRSAYLEVTYQLLHYFRSSSCIEPCLEILFAGAAHDAKTYAGH